MASSNPYIKTKQAADILGVSVNTLRANYAKYQIRRADYGTHFRYHIDDCREWVNKQNRPANIILNGERAEYLRKRMERPLR